MIQFFIDVFKGLIIVLGFVVGGILFTWLIYLLDPVFRFLLGLIDPLLPTF